MRKSKYLISDEQFVEAVKSSISIAETLRKLGLSIYGSSYKTFKIRAKSLDLDWSHFTGQISAKERSSKNKRTPLNKILIQNSNVVFSGSFKRRLIKEGLIEEKCAICGLGPIWCDQPITLQIDHINGDCFDHRLENLRLLCPNCHSRTITFGSKSLKKITKTQRCFGVAPPLKEKVKYFCSKCGKEIKRSDSKTCEECYRLYRKELQTPFDRNKKIVWPPIEEILSRLESISFLQLAKELGVSDNAIRKHIKNNKKD